MDWDPLHQRPLLIYSLGALLLGAQLMSIGFIAELITAYYGQDNTPYSVKSTTGENKLGSLGHETTMLIWPPLMRIIVIVIRMPSPTDGHVDDLTVAKDHESAML